MQMQMQMQAQQQQHLQLQQGPQDGGWNGARHMQNAWDAPWGAAQSGTASTCGLQTAGQERASGADKVAGTSDSAHVPAAASKPSSSSDASMRAPDDSSRWRTKPDEKEPGQQQGAFRVAVFFWNLRSHP
eukprot:gnl/TRDRNA2_/TRDRNA2_17176_c0_seq1.p2 gnl/TRDRNA2_/TRDRNA2_17176_c0~~gnl/TRDRNA2_/TRDRNA2_17176_c0_seq1.p2  ORF type:complete len:130 (+),score=32.62 gnl/TRDRNA2_/TRDRNA2_17176_c0_seq1:1-390(+)